MLSEILTAVALVLVIEGLLPFISPDLYKNTLRAMLELEPEKVRMGGLSLMLVGLLVLTLVH